MQATNQTIRLRCDETSRNAVLDANTGSTPQAWARAGTQFQIGLASAGNIVTDVSNLASVTIEAALASNRDGARVLSATVPGSALSSALTETTWDIGTAQHAVITFTAAEMNFLALGSPYTANYWLVVSGITTGGVPIVFGTGTLTVNDPGTNFTASTPPPNPGAYLTIDQAAATYQPLGSGGGGGSFAPAITSVGDGAPGSLEAVATAGQTVPLLKTILIAATGEMQDWVLAAGSDPTDALHQRPEDYAASGLLWTRKR